MLLWRQIFHLNNWNGFFHLSGKCLDNKFQVGNEFVEQKNPEHNPN